MDRDNLHDLQRIHQRGGGKAKVMLFGEFAGKKKAEEVDDPYYGANVGIGDFAFGILNAQDSSHSYPYSFQNILS